MIVLTMNAGSSSLKFSASTATHPPRRILRGVVSSIGTSDAELRVERGDANETRLAANVDHAGAVKLVLDEIAASGERVGAVGHRIVHGGATYDKATRITPEVMSALEPLA